MITTKRQIITNDDRFIGTADDEARTASAFSGDIRAEHGDISIVNEPLREEHETYDISLRNVKNMPVVEPKQAEQPFFSTRETLNVNIPPRPAKQSRPHDVEDVMPSLKTLNAAERKADVMPTEKTAAAERAAARPRAYTNLSPKMKVILFVCLAIALVLAVAVIATGVSISHATAESEELAAQIASKQAVIAEQQATIADLTNDSALRDQAILQGMVPAGDAEYNANRAEKFDYPEAAPHTNPFDSFCDWLSGIID